MNKISVILILSVGVLQTACGKKLKELVVEPGNEPVAEIALATIGGAFMALEEQVSGALADALACPKPGLNLNTCDSGTGRMLLGYANCNFQKPDASFTGASWSGGHSFQFLLNDTPRCPLSFQEPAVLGYQIRRTVNEGTTRTDSNGLAITLDSTTASGWDDSVSPPAVGGSTTVFERGAQGRRTIEINGIRYLAKKGKYTVWDYTISSPFNQPIQVSRLSDGHSVMNGMLLVQNNIDKTTARVALKETRYNPVTCGCQPLSGSVVAEFSGKKVKDPETLNLMSCGNATFEKPKSDPAALSLKYCF